MARGLLSSVFNIPMEKTGQMGIDVFRQLVNEAINMGIFLATGKLELQTAKTKEEIMRLQYDELKRKGILHGK